MCTNSITENTLERSAEEVPQPQPPPEPCPQEPAMGAPVTFVSSVANDVACMQGTPVELPNILTRHEHQDQVVQAAPEQQPAPRHSDVDQVTIDQPSCPSVRTDQSGGALQALRELLDGIRKALDERFDC